MKICSKPNRFPVKWLCTAGFRAKKLISVVGLKVLQKNGESQKYWKNSRNLLHSVPDRGGALKIEVWSALKSNRTFLLRI